MLKSFQYKFEFLWLSLYSGNNYDIAYMIWNLCQGLNLFCFLSTNCLKIRFSELITNYF